MTRTRCLIRSLPARILVLAAVLLPLAASPTWAEVTVASLQAPDSPSVTLLPDGTDDRFPDEEPWPEESPVHWTDPENPESSFVANAELIASGDDYQSWQGEVHDALTGDLVATLEAKIQYSDAGNLWTVTVQRFPNRFGHAPIPPTTVTELFEADPDGDIAIPGDITWLLIVLAANALALVLTAGGWVPNGCNKPCSNKWILCCIPHDACYCVGGTEANRKFCDVAFALCLAAAGMPAKSVKAYYGAVRLFGRFFFNYRKDAPAPPELPELEPGVGALP